MNAVKAIFLLSRIMVLRGLKHFKNLELDMKETTAALHIKYSEKQRRQMPAYLLPKFRSPCAINVHGVF